MTTPRYPVSQAVFDAATLEERQYLCVETGDKGQGKGNHQVSPIKATSVKAQASIKVSEADWQQTVVDLARIYGWKVALFRPARVNVKGKETYRTAVGADGVGFTDLVLARCKDGSRQILFAELKSETGTIAPTQREWLDLLGGYLWRPSDYETVERLLR